MSDEDTRPTRQRRGTPRRAYAGRAWWWWATAAICAVALLGSVFLLSF